ncbi:MAG: hypothetical protein JNN23_04845 [Chryseobacterium gambrini]|nr:hypothetical protein [Chryseobacterium gambrini]
MEFDFKELVAKAYFDYVGPAFPSWWGKNKTKFVIPSLKNISRELLTNGQYFQQLTLSYGSKKYKFPNEPLISLSQTKTIVETATVGKYRRGTVKEYICTEDYQLTIRGVCINEEVEDRDEYPTEQVELLHELFKINDSVEVEENLFLELFDIQNIVLKTFDLDEMAGEQGQQRFTMTAVSDQPFFADLIEKEKMSKLT